MPYFFLKIFFRILFAPYALNPIKGIEPSGERMASISKEYSLAEVKKISKALDGTLNDLILAITTTVIKKYFAECGRTDFTRIIMCCPVSMRQKGDYEIYNNIGTVPFYVPLTDNVIEGIKEVQAAVGYMRTSGEPLAMYYFVNSTTILPIFLAMPLIHWYASKITVTLTNIPGPRELFDYDGVKGHSIMAFGPGVGNLAGAIACITCSDNLKFGITMDKVNIPNPRKIMEMYETELDSLLASNLGF